MSRERVLDIVVTAWVTLVGIPLIWVGSRLVETLIDFEGDE